MADATTIRLSLNGDGPFRHIPRCRSLVACVAFLLVIGGTSTAFGHPVAEAKQSAAKSEPVLKHEMEPEAVEAVADDVQTLQFTSAGTIQDSDTFDTDLSKSDLLEAKDRAWQYRPYRVAVWLCMDGSPELSAVSEHLKRRLLAQAELVDPSGWDLAVDAAPRHWRWQLLDSIETVSYTHLTLPTIYSV